ncbi:MAG: hypothetical protein EP338_13825 [Bacteroidetes bacterium]|nr:MAG: hypothetical protein EP338_13825 [Bacteroidota bacterium]
MKKIGLLVLSISLFGTIFAQNVRYVRPGATGNGTSWAKAYGEWDIQTAMDELELLGGGQVWIAAGTYFPTSGNNRNVSFEMKNNVELYGGFGGTETSLSMRDLTSNATILSGDIGQVGQKSDNSKRVLEAVSVNTVLNGISVEDGYDNILSAKGAGIYVDQSAIKIDYCHFRNNENAGMNGSGAAIYVNQSQDVQVSYCTIESNQVYSVGALRFVASEASVFNTIIRNNIGTEGSPSISCYSSTVRFENGLVYGNEVLDLDGYNNSTDAVFLYLVSSTFHLLGSTVVDNVGLNNMISSTASSGQTSQLNVRNSILRNPGLKEELRIVINSVHSIEYSNVRGIQAGNQNIDVDPLFVDAANHNYRLQCASPCLDAGTNISSFQNVDLAGLARVQNTTIDLGAYETDPNDCCTPVGGINIRYVKPGGKGSGTSWADAYGEWDVQTAIDEIEQLGGGQVWLAEGSYYPTAGTSRSATWNMKSLVEVYGGFSGAECRLEDRNWAQHQTILSGNIGASNLASDNSYHIITCNNVKETVLDGVIVEKGTSNMSSNDRGAGMYVVNSTVRVENCTFRRNISQEFGGAIYVSGSTFLMNSCLLYKNHAPAAKSFGGAIYATNSGCRIYSSTITENKAFIGTGVSFINNSVTPRVYNSIIWGNSGGNLDLASNTSLLGAKVISNNPGTWNVDPMFNDPGNEDYTLSCKSPAIDAANHQYVLSTLDLGYEQRTQGKQTDIGAFESNPANCCVASDLFIKNVSDVHNGVQSYPFNIGTYSVLTYVVPSGLGNGDQMEVQLSSDADFIASRSVFGTVSTDFRFTDLCPNSLYFVRAKRTTDCDFGATRSFSTGELGVFYPISVVDASHGTQLFTSTDVHTSTTLETDQQVRINPRIKGLTGNQFAIHVSRFADFSDVNSQNMKVATGSVWKSASAPVFNLKPCRRYYVRMAMVSGESYDVTDLQNCVSDLDWGVSFDFMSTGCPGQNQAGKGAFGEAYRKYAVSPNPFDSEFGMEVPYDLQVPVQVDIMKPTGEVLESIQSETNTKIVLGSGIRERGMYIVRLSYDGNFDQFRVIKN